MEEKLKFELLEGFEKELRRGSLVLIVLTMLKDSAHGYELLTRIEKTNITMDTDTIYPLLRRLESQGLLSSRWEMVDPRPRKIYELTSLGKKVLSEMKKIWQKYGKTIEGMINND